MSSSDPQPAAPRHSFTPTPGKPRPEAGGGTGDDQREAKTADATPARVWGFTELFVWGAARSQFWSLTAQGLAALNAFIVVALLSVYHFGLYQLVLSVVAVAEAFSTGLFDDIVANDISRNFAEGRRPEAKRLFSELVASKLVSAGATLLILLVAADLIASAYDRDIASYVRLAGILIVLNALRSLATLFFQAAVSYVAFGASSIQEIARTLLLAALWYFLPAVGLVEVLLVSIGASSVAFLYLAVWFFREYRRIFAATRAFGGWLLPGIVRRYGFLVFLRYSASKAIKQMDAWLVRVFLNTEAVGLYALAVNLLSLVQAAIPTKIFGTLLPREVGDERRLAYLYRRCVKYALWGGAAVAFFAGLAIPPLAGIALPKYEPAMGLFRLLLLTIPLYGVYKFQKAMLFALREQGILTARLFAEGLVTTAVLVVFLPLIGLAAVVVEFLVTYGGRVLLFAFLLARRYPELVLKPVHLLAFDREDGVVLRRALGELRHPGRWFRPVRLT